MGKKEGYGEYKWSNGSLYRGYWKDNKLCGKGVYYYENGNKYIGECKDNCKEGKGKYFWKDGKTYFGEYAKDKKEGIGKYNWEGKEYLGFWKSNKQNGLGKYKGPGDDKNKFGIWLDGKRTQWIDEEALQNESNKYFKEYQQILEFDTDFTDDDLDEKKIIQNI